MNEIKVCLNICGIECTLTSEDNGAYVLVLGDEVEKSIQSITPKNDRVSSTLAAVITALSFCDDAKKAAAAADNLCSQIKDYLEDSSRSRLEADEVRREIERMRRETQTLRARLSARETAQSPAREPVRSVLAVPVQEKPAPSPGSKPLEEPEGPESPFEEEQSEGSWPAVPAVPNVHTGHYFRSAPVQVPGELDRSSFVSFSGKKETDQMSNISVRRKKGTL